MFSARVREARDSSKEVGEKGGFVDIIILEGDLGEDLEDVLGGFRDDKWMGLVCSLPLVGEALEEDMELFMACLREMVTGDSLPLPSSLW
jgi:hypothetical protein